MTPVPRAILDWLLDRLGFLPEPIPRVLALPVFVIGLYVTLAFVARRLAPWLVQRVAAPLALGLVTVAGAAAFAIEFVFSCGFRVARRRPWPLLYGFGDVVAAATARAQHWIRTGAATLRRMSRVRTPVLVLAVVAAIWWSDMAYCGGADQTCRSPVRDWVQAVQDVRR